MAYQQIGTHVDAGGPTEYFDCPNVPVQPLDVGIAVHELVGQTGAIGAQVDTVLNRIVLEVPGVPGQQYRCSGRINHSLNTRRFFGQVVSFPVGASFVDHGLGAVPEMYYAQYADLLGNPPFNVYGVDATSIYVENFGAVPVNLAVYAWLLHSIDTPRATSGGLDVSLVAGAAPVAVPHGLAVTPDLILPCHFQAGGGLAPNGIPVITAADDTDIYVATTAAAGNPLNLRIFAQRTHSIQQ